MKVKLFLYKQPSTKSGRLGPVQPFPFTACGEIAQGLTPDVAIDLEMKPVFISNLLPGYNHDLDGLLAF